MSTVLPLCVIAFSYTKTARHLVKSAQPISEETQIPQLKTRNITAKIVVGLTVVFLISYVPNHVLWTYITFNIFPISVKNFVDALRYTIIVSAYLLLLNPCLNPVALFCTSLAFRRQFKRYLTCRFKTNSPLTNLELTRRN
jgi:multisubunit Na+/H+ antiporter MnhB subunit